MPAYNFQKQFVPMILDGSKPHTIRRRRKRPTKVGDRLYLYIGLRTKQCEMFAISQCVKVEPIVIWPFAKLLTKTMTGQALSKEKVKEISSRDGFDNVNEFYKFFERYGTECLEDFEIIWWDQGLLVPVGNRKGGTMRLQLGGDARPGVCSLGYNMDR